MRLESPEQLSGELPPVKDREEEEEEGVIGRGLSGETGEGVRGIARSGGTFRFSVRKAPSMTASVGKESTRVLTEKAEEPTCIMGGGIESTFKFGEVRERGGGRGERRRNNFEGISSRRRADELHAEKVMGPG